MQKTCIDHLPSAEQVFDKFFLFPTKLGLIGHNNPALSHQSVSVTYYYRAAHLFQTGSAKYRRAIMAARDRINFAKPLSCSLYRELTQLINKE